MERGLFDFSANGTYTLIPMKGGSGNIRSVTLTNYDTIVPCNVDLYLEDKSSSKAYITKSLQIPRSSTVRIIDYVGFDNDVLGLKLVLTSTSPKLTVIIK
tara:strand:+ start:1712 stop:2011 length:300 start_codon:yes stop_codon:yes gene_type:complete